MNISDSKLTLVDWHNKFVTNRIVRMTSLEPYEDLSNAELIAAYRSFVALYAQLKLHGTEISSPYPFIHGLLVGLLHKRGLECALDVTANAV